MRNRDVDDLIAMAEDFGRRQPVAFMGAAALAGFLASRFLLASAKRRNTQAMAQSGDMQGAYGSSSYAYSERAGGSAGTGDTMGGTI